MNIRIVLFSTQFDNHFKIISTSVTQLFPRIQVDKYCDLNDFSLAVMDMLFGSGILLILIRSQEELEKIFQITERLKDHSTILVLDDSTDDLTQKALQLYPRYTSYIKDDYEDIYLVLEKMIAKMQKAIKGA